MVANVALCVGDLVEDVVVSLQSRFRLGADAGAVVVRRRGGSAANVACAVAADGGRSRFAGRVGSDALADELVAALQREGVDVVVERQGVTGTVVVVVADHERSFLTDRGASAQLAHIDDVAFRDVAWLHLSAYTLATPDGCTAVHAARRRHPQVRLSLDVASTTLIDAVGAEEVRRWCHDLAVDVVLANEHEAAALGNESGLTRLADVAVIKRRAEPAIVVAGSARFEIPTVGPIDAIDPTGAGDAFAGGYIVASMHGADPAEATEAGHRRARRHLTAQGTTATPRDDREQQPDRATRKPA